MDEVIDSLSVALKEIYDEKEIIKSKVESNGIKVVSINVIRKNNDSVFEPSLDVVSEKPIDSFNRFTKSERIDTFTYGLGLEIINDYKKN